MSVLLKAKGVLVSWCPVDGQSVTEGGCGVGGGGEEGRATSRERPLTLKRFHSHSGNISRSMKKKEFRNKKIKKELQAEGHQLL